MSNILTNNYPDYLADSVDAFLTEFASAVPASPTTEQANPFLSPSLNDLPEPAVPLGLTFSFPVEQTALNRGKILTWTKGFAAKNAIGNDVVQLLQDAFDRKHLHVRCVALVNDVSETYFPVYVPLLSYSDCRRSAIARVYERRLRSR